MGVDIFRSGRFSAVPDSVSVLRRHLVRQRILQDICKAEQVELDRSRMNCRRRRIGGPDTMSKARFDAQLKVVRAKVCRQEFEALNWQN